MEQKKTRGFGFRGWMLILYQAIAYITFQCFTQYPLNILADFYGGSQKVANIYSIFAEAIRTGTPGDYPSVADGVAEMRFLEAIVANSNGTEKWTKIRR